VNTCTARLRRNRGSLAATELVFDSSGGFFCVVTAPFLIAHRLQDFARHSCPQGYAVGAAVRDFRKCRFEFGKRLIVRFKRSSRKKPCGSRNRFTDVTVRYWCKMDQRRVHPDKPSALIWWGMRKHSLNCRKKRTPFGSRFVPHWHSRLD
jgi:hypothetical protein